VNFDLFNWHEEIPKHYIGKMDLVLGSDVLYMGNSVKPLAKFIAKALSPMGFALFSDPGRCYTDSFVEECQGNRIVNVWGKC
jgi:predicted TPR repeat methyltransferase